MSTLEELTVNGHQIGYWLGERGCKILADGRPPIVSLEVWGEDLTMEGLARLAVLPLRRLIVGCLDCINDDAVDVLARFTGLEWLDLRYTSMSGPAIVRLVSSLPRLRVLVVEDGRLPPDATLAVKVWPAALY